MASPAKRRKKNDFRSSDRPIGSLDFFFNKQNTSNRTSKAANDASTAALSLEVLHGADGKGLTDEELAKKLQAEWDAEAAGLDEENGTAKVDAPSQDGTKVADGSVEASELIVNVGPVEDGGNTVDAPTTHESMSSDPKSKPQTLSLQASGTIEDSVTTDIPFDESPLSFDPARYVPDLHRTWSADNNLATYALLTRCFVLVSSTQSRIKIVDTLVNLLRTIIVGDPASLLPTVWLATNSISPPYIDLELGLGGSIISKALKKVCGLNNAGLKTLYDKYGDAGDVAFEAKKRQSFTLRKPKPLTIKSVFDGLVKIANSKGAGSQETKQRIVERLIQDARGAEESRFIVRTLVQHLRIGAVKTTMLIALSRAFLLSRPEGAEFETKDAEMLRKLKKEDLAVVWGRAEEVVKACFARRPNYNDLVPALLEIGVSDELLLRCGLALHIPLRPMLGSITRDLQEMLVKLQGRDFSCEYKYDGQRAQVHCDDKGKVTIFSRHLEVMTDKYPDLVSLVPKIRGEGVRSFIMEGEVVAIDRESGELKTFQTLANRARKDVVIGSVTIDVCLFAFDLMYLNGQELLDRSFRERRDMLKSLFVEIPQYFTWVNNLDATSADSEAVLEFFKSALEYKCEGIMVKVLDNLPNPDLQPLEEDSVPVEPGPLAPSTKGKKGAPKAATKVAKEKLQGRRKALLSTYEPDKRLDSWLKVKKDYDSASFDTLDLIPIAAWHGQGRKAKWWSPILMAVRNPETGNLQAVTKCMSGFTDKFYMENRKKYDPDVVCGDANSEAEGSDSDKDSGNADVPKVSNHTLPSKPAYVEYSGHPDVWFNPQEVWEMAFADITLSPTYTAAFGLVSEERGLSLRFPRFLKVREDKSIEEASDADFLASLWRKQEAGPKGGKAPGADDVGDDDGVGEE